MATQIILANKEDPQMKRSIESPLCGNPQWARVAHQPPRYRCRFTVMATVFAATAVALAFSGVAQGTTMISLPIRVALPNAQTTPYVECTLVNGGTKPLAAVPPAGSIQIQIFDESGNAFNEINNCGATLPPGQGCFAFAQPSGSNILYCKITFSGNKAQARASFNRVDTGAYGSETTLVVPVQ
jgi:hypothetical protein